MFPHPNTCFPLKSVRSLNSLLLVSGFSHFHVCNYADTVSTYMLVVNKYADTKSVPSINNTDTCQHSQRLCGHTFSECIHSCWLFVFSNTVLYLKENENFCKTAFASSYGIKFLPHKAKQNISWHCPLKCTYLQYWYLPYVQDSGYNLNIFYYSFSLCL